MDQQTQSQEKIIDNTQKCFVGIIYIFDFAIILIEWELEIWTHDGIKKQQFLPVLTYQNNLNRVALVIGLF